MLDLKQRCTDRSVYDIKVQRERLDKHFFNFVLMSNKSCCFAFLLKQCCCCKVIQLQLCCWVLKQVWFFFLPYQSVFTYISLYTWFKCGWMLHVDVWDPHNAAFVGWVGVLNNFLFVCLFFWLLKRDLRLLKRDFTVFLRLLKRDFTVFYDCLSVILQFLRLLKRDFAIFYNCLSAILQFCTIA